MVKNLWKMQLCLSRYQSLLEVSDDARKRLEIWDVSVRGEIKNASAGAARLRELYAAGERDI